EAEVVRRWVGALVAARGGKRPLRVRGLRSPKPVPEGVQGDRRRGGGEEVWSGDPCGSRHPTWGAGNRGMMKGPTGRPLTRTMRYLIQRGVLLLIGITL